MAKICIMKIMGCLAVFCFIGTNSSRSDDCVASALACSMASPPTREPGLLLCQPTAECLRVSLRDDLPSRRTGTVAGPRPAVGQDTVGLLTGQAPG